MKDSDNTQTVRYDSLAFQENWLRLKPVPEPLNRTRRERHLYVFELIKAITAISVLLSIFSFALTILNRKEDQAAHKKEEALRLLRQWDERFSNDRQSVLELWRKTQVPTQPVEQMSRQTAQRLWAAASPESSWTGDPDEQKLASLLVSLLNFLESVSVAVQSGAADPEMMKNSVETPLIDWRRHLKPFTDVADAQLTANKQKPMLAWGPFYRLADEWRDQQKAANPGGSRPQHIYGTRP